MADVPAGVVTVTSTDPAVPAGARTRSDVPVAFTVPLTSVAPNEITTPETNPEPATLTAVPAVSGPVSGLTEVTTGTP